MLSFPYLFLRWVSFWPILTTWSLSQPLGSAARPLDKKKVVVLGAGGSMGGLTFGFLQRACSLYGTGLGDYRALAASSDTSMRLNSYLAKHFCLSYANEANVKLTDLTSVKAIQSRLAGFDALLLGSDMATQSRKVTFGTYEKSPNDKCNELYWKGPSTLVKQVDTSAIVESVVNNVLEAAKEVGIKQVIFVDESGEDSSSSSSPYTEWLESFGVPFTRIRPMGELVSIPSYTYQMGVQGELVLNREQDGSSPYDGRCYEEDIAALCVQCLLTLDWNKSRSISVSTAGPATRVLSQATTPRKRPDQEWCVNSFLLEQALTGIV